MGVLERNPLFFHMSLLVNEDKLGEQIIRAGNIWLTRVIDEVVKPLLLGKKIWVRVNKTLELEIEVHEREL